MFAIKKIITSFLIPPGIVIIILAATGIWSWRRNQRLCALLYSAIAAVLWCVSAGPVSDVLMRRLEAGLTVPAHARGDVIILLGGGLNEGVPDLTGSGAPSEDMLARLVTAVRLQRQLDIPVIISGGHAYAGRSAEAPVVRRFLIDLGVQEKKILLESRSRDTMENATYSREILRQRGFTRPLLVTSAYHMRRSIEAFRLAGISVTPVPAQFSTGGNLPHIWADFLPDSGALHSSAKALKEYLGLLFYRLSYK
jgi:uncharacterized SAM-binding protein YcdF (DUF218 family)